MQGAPHPPELRPPAPGAGRRTVTDCSRIQQPPTVPETPPAPAAPASPRAGRGNFVTTSPVFFFQIPDRKPAPGSPCYQDPLRGPWEARRAPLAGCLDPGSLRRVSGDPGRLQRTGAGRRLLIQGPVKSDPVLAPF